MDIPPDVQHKVDMADQMDIVVMVQYLRDTYPADFHGSDKDIISQAMAKAKLRVMKVGA